MRLIGLTVVLAISLFAGPVAVGGQDATKRPLVGFLCNTTELAPAFGDGLRELGYVAGRTFSSNIVARKGGQNADRNSRPRC